MLRIERLEEEVAELRAALQMVQTSEVSVRTALVSHHSPSIAHHTVNDTAIHGSPIDHRSVAGSTSSALWQQPSMNNNAVESGLVSWDQAVFWFQR